MQFITNIVNYFNQRADYDYLVVPEWTYYYFEVIILNLDACMIAAIFYDQFYYLFFDFLVSFNVVEILWMIETVESYSEMVQ